MLIADASEHVLSGPTTILLILGIWGLLGGIAFVPWRRIFSRDFWTHPTIAEMQAQMLCEVWNYWAMRRYLLAEKIGVPPRLHAYLSAKCSIRGIAMTTNSERAAFRARSRAHTFQFPPPREVDAWMAPLEERSLFRMILCGLLLSLLVVLGLGFATRTAEDFKHEQWAKQAVDECVANGGAPQVYRDNHDYVLGVRCL